MPLCTPHDFDVFELTDQARRNLNLYPQLAAYDSSTIHAGDNFVTHYGDNNVSTSGPVVLLDRTLLKDAPPHLYSFIEELRNTTLLLEEIQCAARQLEAPRPCARARSRNLRQAIFKSDSGSRGKARRAQLPPHATLQTSINYTISNATSRSSGRPLSMKVRFTINYSPASAYGSASHWYEWSLDFVDPRHRRLLSSSCSGIGIVDIDENAELFPSSEVFVSLKQGWIWNGSDESDSNSDCHTKAERVECIPGSRTFETDWHFSRCSCWLCQ